jgi:hypothetical protein
MIIDAQLQVSNAVALTSGTVVSVSSYDTGAPAVTSTTQRDVGVGEPVGIAIAIGVAATITGAADQTYEFDVIQSAAAALTSPDIIDARKFKVTPAAGELAASLLTAGTILYLPLSGMQQAKQYLGLQYILGGTGPTVTVTSWITPLSMLQAQRAYGTKIIVL